MNGRLSRVMALATALAFLAGCGASARVLHQGGPNIDQARAEQGKARLAVVGVTNRARGANSAVASGIADMLVTALFQTGRFIILERRRLGPVLREQNLGRGGRVNVATAASVGRLEGAELILTGELTRFDRNRVTAGSFLLGLATFIGSLILRYKTRGKTPFGMVAYLTSTVGIRLKIIDTKTGRIVAVTEVEGSARDWGGAIGAPVFGLPLVLSQFGRTAMGRAIRAAVDRAAKAVADKAPRSYFRVRTGGPVSGQLVRFMRIRLPGADGRRLGRRYWTVLRTPAQWRGTLKALGVRGQVNPPDFSRYMVALVTSGPQPSTGHKVDFEEVVYRGGKVLFFARDLVPPPGAKNIHRVTSYPVAAIVVPRINQPLRLLWRRPLAWALPPPVKKVARRPGWYSPATISAAGWQKTSGGWVGAGSVSKIKYPGPITPVKSPVGPTPRMPSQAPVGPTPRMPSQAPVGPTPRMPSKAPAPGHSRGMPSKAPVAGHSRGMPSKAPAVGHSHESPMSSEKFPAPKGSVAPGK